MERNKPELICYNFWPTLANHGYDASKEYYRSCGVERLHDFDSLSPEKIKPNDIVFCKTDAIHTNDLDLELIQVPFTLITAVSALQIVPARAKKIVSNPNIIRWYATNPPAISSDKIIPIPIGFEEQDREGGNQVILASFLNFKIDFKDKMSKVFIPYHTLNTNPSRRSNLEYLRNKDFTYAQMDRVDFQTYLSFMEKYKFIACFCGYGFDTHRYYEALLVGSVPIMKKSPMVKLFERYGLPGVFLDEWSELTDKKFGKLMNNNYDFSRVEEFLSTQFWHNLIKKGG